MAKGVARSRLIEGEGRGEGRGGEGGEAEGAKLGQRLNKINVSTFPNIINF